VEYRDGDKASVPDDVEQDFHPDGHKPIPLPVGKSAMRHLFPMLKRLCPTAVSGERFR
jgi:hypothetical protein